MTPFPSITHLRAPRVARLSLLFLLVTLPGLASWARAQNEIEVRVEAVRPQKPKFETLQFLKQNRDFIRARFDRLRQTPLEGRDAGPIDPRFLAYSRMLTEILAAGDSITVADEARQRQLLLASIT